MNARTEKRGSMTPLERAKALVPPEWCGTTEERIEMIAAAIRAAENEALERAAQIIEGAANRTRSLNESSPLHALAGRVIEEQAAEIRSLKEPTPGT